MSDMKTKLIVLITTTMNICNNKTPVKYRHNLNNEINDEN